MPLSLGIRLHLSELQSINGLSFQVIQIELTQGDRLIEPAELAVLSLPPGIDTRSGVILSGRAPIWLYAHLVHELHPTAWVACYDPRIGAVVVATHSRQARIGQILPIHLEGHGSKLRQCPALMVVGPPDSGKSVFSHALFTSLLPNYPDVFLQRANWDGEGNWILELPNGTDEEREACKQRYKGEASDRFYPYHAQAILALRRQKQLVIVDVGGKVQDTKIPLLDACSHYLVISSDPDKISEWHEFCRDRGNLKPVAVIHSSSQNETCEITYKWEPYLEMSLPSNWITQLPRHLPDSLLTTIQSLLPTA